MWALLLCVTLSLAATGPTTFFVGPGTASGDCRTASTACSCGALQTAVAGLSQGLAIFLLPGTYSTSCLPNAASQYTAQAYSLPAPVISGAASGPVTVSCPTSTTDVVTFRGLVFDDCSSGCISVLSNNTCKVVVDNCVFQNAQSASASPVSVDASMGALQISSSTFVGNAVNDASGAVSLTRMVSSVFISSCQFVQNKMKRVARNNTGGGAVSYQTVNSASTMQIDSCVFRGNSLDAGTTAASVRGGALHVASTGGGIVTISSSIFHNNSCNSDGGAIVIADAPQVTLDLCLLQSNRVVDTASSIHVGGAVAVFSPDPSFVTFIECTFRGNSVSAVDEALGGAVAYGIGGSLNSPSMVNSSFFDNSASAAMAQGGAILGGVNAGSTLDLATTVFCGNTVVVSGASSPSDVQEISTTTSVVQPEDTSSSFFAVALVTFVTNCSAPYLNNASFVTTADMLQTRLIFVGAAQVPGGIVSVSSAGITVIGNLLLPSGSSLQVAAGGVVTVTGLVVIQPGAMLQLTGVSDSGGTVQVLTYAQVQGNFSTITATSTSGCPNTASPSYGSSSLSVTVAVSCSGLSTGAIVGIAVGAAVAGVLVIVAMALLIRHFVIARDAKTNKEIAMAQFQ